MSYKLGKHKSSTFMIIKILFGERIRTKRVRCKAQLAFICIAFFLSLNISPASFSQDFTARTIGDFGNVTVMEATGNYDAKNPDGSTNDIPRQAIAKEFFKTHKDEYDFLVIFSNFNFQMPDAQARAFYLEVKNDVQGIGKQIFDSSSFFGSNGKLQGMIDMGDISKLVTDPLDPKFEETLFTLSHELMHRWGAYVKFKNSDGSISTALLGKDKSHWSFLLDSKASVLYGNQWQDNGNGTFTSIDAGKYYSPLDLYLMGFYEKSQVPPMLLIDNPGIDPARMPEIGVTINGMAGYVTIDDIIAAEGGRIPGPSTSQKIFKTAFILITAPSTFRGDEIYGIENIRNGCVTRFSVLTDSYGILNVDITHTEDIPTNPGPPEPPYIPRSIPPNIEDGVKWLMSHQGSDGSWMDMPQTTERDTAETVLILKNFDMAKGNYESGIQWLNAVPSGNIDYLSRRIEVLVQAGQDVEALLDEMLSRQNPDGGWGSHKEYLSNPIDTSFALKSMALAGYTKSSILSKAIDYLKSKQNADGGWGIDDGESSIPSTANVLSAFNQFRKGFPLNDSISKGILWLIQRQNSDGGFGNSPSTIYDTAIAVLTLREFGVSTDTISSGLNYLLNHQSGDGSWYGSPYQTAIAVSAVWKATVDPDLSIKSDDITFTPPSVKNLPSNILIQAKIWNSGRTDVAQAKVVLYDGILSEANKVSEQVQGFPGQSSVTVSFSVTLKDGNEHRFYITVDPENMVKESNETNNIASKILYPEPTYDFEILPSDVSVSQNPVDIFSDVKITSRITNKGTMNAYNVQVRYTIDEVGGPIDIATVTVDIPANSSITKGITCRAIRAGENLPITVYVDPSNVFEELSETNNKAFTYLTVKGSAEPNLTISYKDIVITPTPAHERGSVNISALVKNEGFSAVSNINVSFYKGVPGKDGVLLGSQIIPSLNTGESKRVSIDWTNIPDSGERVIYVQVDPGNQVKEISKNDNDAFVTLKILSLPDLTISTNSIVFKPTAPKDGDKVAITVTVQNKGEQDVSNVTVRASEGNAVIGSQIIPSISGNSQSTGSFTYDTAGKSGPHKITITVDPDNAIIEQSKDNNQASRTFGVQKADLWLTEPYISPNGDGIKDSTQFFFRLTEPKTVKITVLNGKGETVRTFTGAEFENTTGGNITWDGLDSNGRVVNDGQYQIKVVDTSNNALGSLLVVVDNNRSPLTDAIGTKYLLNVNLTCMLPNLRDWIWFPDESGILFQISEQNQNAPEYPVGLYTMSPDGEDILRVVPWEWAYGVDPTYDYSILDYALSPDGEKVAFTLQKQNRNVWGDGLRQLWVVGRDGKDLALLDSYIKLSYNPSQEYTVTDLSVLQWSPDNAYTTYSVSVTTYDSRWREKDYLSELWITRPDGIGKTKILSIPRSRRIYDEDVKWSPDGGKIAYLFGSLDANGNYVTKLKLSDISGNGEDIFVLDHPYSPSIEWLNNLKLLVSEEIGELWLVDASGGGNHVRVSDNIEGKISIAPDRRSFAFHTFVGKTESVNVSDSDGKVQVLHGLTITGTCCCFYSTGIVWSPDSSQIAFKESVEDCPETYCHCSEKYSPTLVVIDVRTGEETAFAVSDTSPFVKWLSDGISIIGTNYSSTYVTNSETGQSVSIASDVYSLSVSPSERYITYSQYPDQSSVCYGRGYNDLWAMSSLLNLTANLRATKEKTAVIFKGVAADLNFEGYKLEYADVKSPEVWNLIAPPSDVPVIDEVFTTWVPPYEGTFYARLTVWDKAGNVVWDRKRVSWGLSATVTNLYKTLEIFSPNGDGVKDTVELHYRVLEPVHLEFNIYDQKGNLKRAFLKDYSFPAEDYIAWDGRDEYGKVVSDGKYQIKVFDYEFFVEVDNTFPAVNIELGSVQLVSVEKEIHEIIAELVGHAFDHHIKNWVIEYGEGDNPQEWFEFTRGVDILAKRDDEGNPILNPVKDTLIERFIDQDIEWLVGKKLRITAEDSAGNKSTAVTEFLEEKIILSRWDTQSVLGIIPAHLARPGLHSLGGLETIRLPIVSFNVQYWGGDRWFDASSVMDPPSGGIHLEWNNSVLNLQEGYAVRVKAVDILGQEHYSNALRTMDLFNIYKNEKCELGAKNSLFEKLQLMKFQVTTSSVMNDSQWTDYLVLDSERGDAIPEGEFAPPLPPIQSGMKYVIRMTGIGTSGEEYGSGTVDYPPRCDDKIRIELTVTYNEADCGLTSHRASLDAKIKGFVSDISLKALGYYLEKPEGLQLLRQFDLTREGWGNVEVDSLNMPEGNYPVKVILTYLDLSDNTNNETSASSTLVVDRALPTARITYPVKSMMLCPVKVSSQKGDWYGIPVEGIATDNNGINKYELSYGIGESPSGWIPATTRKMDVVSPISGNGPIQGSLGLWDITSQKGKTFSLLLKAVDKAGNVKCDATSFSFDNLAEIVHLSTDKPLFSPNGDGILDEMEIRYEIDEYATVDMKVFKLIEVGDSSYALDSLPVRTIVSGLQHLRGMENTSWDGQDDSNTAVPDGLYGITIFAKDSCGNTNLKWTSVEVDNSPPQTIITYPRPPDPIGIIVEVRGTVDDLNFQNYLLEASKVDQPDTWFLISSNNNPVKDDVLGTWNNSGLDGRWTLRLTAIDKTGNKNTATVTIDLGSRKNLIKELTATSRFFSPNNDGKVDTTIINYELTDACDVKIEFLDLNGTVKRTYTSTVFSGGTYIYTWDGKGNTGGVVSDGPYTVKLTATLSSNPSVTQNETITLIVDSISPIVHIQQPLNNSCVKGPVTLMGTISDRNLLEYSLSYTGEAGTVPLDKANQNRENHTFGILPDLAEGSYILHIEARDLGENITRRDVGFTVDRTPPQVTLSTPKEGEYYGSEKNVIPITGAIVEKNLETYSLRYGAGDNPAQWTDLVNGNAVPSNPQLLSWKVGKNDGIPDGLYTLSLYAKDKAGSTGEGKVEITIDNTAPEVAILSPKEGDYVKAPIDIRGTASDTNLEKYNFEISEDQCSNAFKWAAIKTATNSIKDGLLAAWLALPPDGDYCLRLTALDKIGNKAETKVSVKVDIHPPAAPVLSGKVENKADIRLSWTQNKEPDLAGFHIYRDKQKINTELIRLNSYLDQNLKEGIYTYTVQAVDFAGNESKPSNEEKIKVDLTAPDARIRSPQDGSRISGLADIKGTAYSPDDFKQYRVSIGQGSAPSGWNLIRTSPVPISYGTLVQWDTLGLPEGSYSVRLEAEDLSGNTNMDQVVVTVDNNPPEKPELISAIPNNSDATLTWKANTEPDLAGYLLYRNDQLANVSGIVIGNLIPYLVGGTTYVDKALPDGKSKYYLVAMDFAGNMSDPSNTLEVNIDTGEPHATIAEPKDKSKFQDKTLIKAEASDIDILSIQFQYKKAQDTTWVNLGASVKQTPYITYIDPVRLGLTYGDYQLRAVATDLGGKADPSPSLITVTYINLIPPDVPKDLKAQTNGKDVILTWAASHGTDLDGYYVYRTLGSAKAKVNTSIIKEATHQDNGLSDGLYTYEVTAVDTYGNESEPSNSASAKVYAPLIEQPYTPVGKNVINIHGSNSVASASVEIYNGTTSGSLLAGKINADVAGSFTLADLNLSLGENRITAKATDSTGNVSRSSEMVVIVYNEPPSQPTGLNSSVEDYNVNLTWNPNTEADLWGYNLYRDGEKMNQPVAIISGDTTSSSSDYYHSPSMAFDSYPSTYWASSYVYETFIPVWLEIDLPDPELINHVGIGWGSGIDSQGNEILYAGKDYEIQVWSGYAWITQTKITGNSAKENTFDFNPPYGTDRIRIYIKDTTDPNYSKQVRITEVRFLKDNLINQASYTDTNLRDGEYHYRITAVDKYGFESLPSDESKPIVGDVIPPSAPQNLTATVSGPHITLDWSPNSENDLAGYNIYRNTTQGWAKINTALIIGTTYTDTNLRNGTYTYGVTAIDRAGNESLPSNEASATVYIAPPQPPESLRISSVPEGRALRASWDYRGGSVAGYNLYRSITLGGPYQKANGSLISNTTFLDTGLTNGVAYYYVVVTVDSFGNESAYSNEAMGVPSDHIPPPKPLVFFPTLSGQQVVLYKDKTDLSGNAEPGSMVELFKDRRSIAKTNAIEGNMIQTFSLEDGAYGLSLSPDGKTLAYTWNDSIWLKDLANGNGASIIQKANYPVWSPDGRKLAYAFVNSNGNNRIGIYDNETGQSVLLTEAASLYDESYPSWSSDGSKIAFTRNSGGSWDLWMKDLISGSLNQVTNKSDVYYSLISPNGRRAAYFEDEGLYVTDLVSGETIAVDPQTADYSLDWSPDSGRLAFVSYRNGNADIFIMDVSSRTQTQMTDSLSEDRGPIWSPDGRSILFVRLEENNSVYVTPSEGQKAERLIQRGPNLYPFSWAKYGGIACFDGNQLKMIYPEGYFSFKDVALNVGGNLFYVTSIDSSGNTGPPSEEISVVFNKSLMPDLGIAADDIFIYPPCPIEGVDATIDVTVWNRGEVEVRDVDVDIYLLDSTGELELLKSEHIPYMAPASGEPIPLTWNTTGKTGTNRVIVVVDPEDRIHELLETNNSTTKEFFVINEEGIFMTTTLDASQYLRGQDMNINVNLRNSSFERDVTVEVRIEDQNGYGVASLDPINTNLPYASVKNYTLLWNTGSTYAGPYRVHTILKNEPSMVSENIVPFTILPEIDVVSAVVTDKTDYDPNEDVTVNLHVKNQGQNYIIPQMNVRVRIADSGNTDLFSEDKEIINLLPGAAATLSSTWNTELHPPGNYQVMVEIYLDGQKISSQLAAFKVNASAILTGHITATPSVVILGGSVRADYIIQNSGNTDLSDVSVKVLVLDSETQTIVNFHEEIVNLFMNSAQTGQFTFLTEGYGLKTYSIQFESLHQGKQKSLAVTSFMVKDGTPPVISLLSPSSNQYFNSKIDVSALATDLASGIDMVEYQVDASSWKLLPISDPSQGRYSTTWNPTLSDEGIRTIRVRATDRAGNTSLPVPAVITIDLTAPSPPTILSPLDNSTLSTEVIDIKGKAEANSTVEMVFGSVLTTTAGSATGEFVYTEVKLIPGENKFVFKASDRAGNVSLPTEYTLYLVKPAIEAKKTIPDIKNLVVWINEECRRDDPIHEQCDDDYKEKYIKLDLLEKILKEATDSYLIVHDREDFEKVKAPYFTDILILGDHHFLSEPYRDELRELVYAGKGLISSLYLKREGCYKETDESLFGLEYKGRLPGGEYQIHFMDSPISQEMALEAKGKAVRVEVDDPDRVVAWIDEPKKSSHYPHREQYPGVVLNQYGIGKTVFLAFDLGLMLDDENYDQVSRILKNAITYAHKPLYTTAFHPYQMVPIQVEIKSLGSAMDARIIETYPSDIKLYDPMTGKWIIDRPWVIDIRLEPGETETVFFYALAPDKAGAYILETEIGYLDNVYSSSQTLSKEIVVEEDSAQMVSDIIRVLKSLMVSKKDKSELEDAIEHMERIQRRAVVTVRDIQRNIDDIMEALDSLLSITCADISDIRLMTDALLEVWIRKLILFPSS